MKSRRLPDDGREEGRIDDEAESALGSTIVGSCCCIERNLVLRASAGTKNSYVVSTGLRPTHAMYRVEDVEYCRPSGRLIDEH